MTQSRVALQAVRPEEFASTGLWVPLAALAVPGVGEDPELWGHNDWVWMFLTPAAAS